jgi:hypothetical protein
VELADDCVAWGDCDLRIYTATQNVVWPHVDCRTGGFLFWGLCGTHMHMPRGWPHSGNGYGAYAHEFGHYGFDLNDEYANGNPSISCTGSAAYPPGNHRASCTMWHDWEAFKFCSDIPINMHRRGTRQGDESCWDKIFRRFRSEEYDLYGAWTLRTPASRGAIPGQLPPLLQDWATRFNLDNRSRGPLCAPREVYLVFDRPGRPPAAGQEVWNRTHYGRDLNEGKLDSNGRLLVTGLHVGDRITCNDYSYTLTPADCTPLSGSPAVIVLGEGSRDPALAPRGTPDLVAQGQAGALQGVVPADPFQAFLVVEPTGAPGQVRLGVKASVALREPPRVSLALSGEDKSTPVPMQASEGGYVGLARVPPGSQKAIIDLQATDTAGRVFSRLYQAAFMDQEPGKTLEAFSAGGRLSLSLPPGALPGGRLVIGPAGVPPPAEGRLLDGPYQLSASGEDRLSQRCYLRFQAGQEGTSARILHYEPSTGRWEALPSLLIPGREILIAPVDRLGAYALVAAP